MKIKFDSDDDLPLNKLLKLPTMTTVVRSVFEYNGKYYIQIFLDRIDISEGIDINKTNVSKECDIGHYWYFSSKIFNCKPYLCNGCYDLMQKAMNFNDVEFFLLKKMIVEFTFGI